MAIPKADKMAIKMNYHNEIYSPLSLELAKQARSHGL